MKQTRSCEKKTAILKLTRAGAAKPQSCEKKTAILKLTQTGAMKPQHTRETGAQYDLLFDKEVKRLRPDWFTSKR